MSEYADAKNYFQRLVNFSSASVYKDMLHHAIAAFARAEAAEAEVERLKGVLEFIASTIGSFEGMGSYTAYVEMTGGLMDEANKALGDVS